MANNAIRSPLTKASRSANGLSHGSELSIYEMLNIQLTYGSLSRFLLPLTHQLQPQSKSPSVFSMD